PPWVSWRLSSVDLTSGGGRRRALMGCPRDGPAAAPSVSLLLAYCALGTPQQSSDPATARCRQLEAAPDPLHCVSPAGQDEPGSNACLLPYARRRMRGIQISRSRSFRWWRGRHRYQPAVEAQMTVRSGIAPLCPTLADGAVSVT